MREMTTSKTVSPFFNQPIGKAKRGGDPADRMVPVLEPVKRDIKEPWCPNTWRKYGSRISNEAGFWYEGDGCFYGKVR